MIGRTKRTEVELAQCIQKRRAAKNNFETALRDLKEALANKHRLNYGRRSDDAHAEGN